MDGNAVARRGPNRVEYEVDADRDDAYWHYERAPEQERILSQRRTVDACVHIIPNKYKYAAGGNPEKFKRSLTARNTESAEGYVANTRMTSRSFLSASSRPSAGI